MISGWWSWVLFANGAFGLWLALNKPRIGSWYNIVGQSGWLIYGLITQQWGFVAQAITYTFVFGQLAWNTYRKDKVHARLDQVERP